MEICVTDISWAGSGRDDPTLFRERGEQPVRLVGWIMLNPSLADTEIDDNTITRCIDYSQQWGYDGMLVANLFGFRSPYPKCLKVAAEPVGPGNYGQIFNVANKTELLVAAWGSPMNRMVNEQAVWVRHLLRYHTMHVLRLTMGGHPHHPLYLPKKLKPELWLAKLRAPDYGDPLDGCPAVGSGGIHSESFYEYGVCTGCALDSTTVGQE